MQHVSTKTMARQTKKTLAYKCSAKSKQYIQKIHARLTVNILIEFFLAIKVVFSKRMLVRL